MELHPIGDGLRVRLFKFNSEEHVTYAYRYPLHENLAIKIAGDD
jgi:hypothetical protein